MAKYLSEEAKNAKVLADLLSHPATTPAMQVRILNTLLTGSKSDDFFQAMFAGKMSLGECPNCKHKNHWLIPEDKLNEMGYVTADRDKNVKRETTKDDCAQFQESCMKRKINV